MTAERSEANGPMRDLEVGVVGTTKAPGPPPGPPPAPPRRRGRRLRRKSPAEGPVKAQLRMRSPSGAFVVLGISVVLVGMTIAVVGYWPHRGAGSRLTGAGNGSAVGGDMRKEVTPGRHVPPHSEKLKLIGPVIMGIGLFIFICANTMLYENRDMETRRLMQKGLYAMAGGLPEGMSPQDGGPQLVPKANTECVEGCYQVDLSGQPCPGLGGNVGGHHPGVDGGHHLVGGGHQTSVGGGHLPGVDGGHQTSGGGGHLSGVGGGHHIIISMDGGCPGAGLVELSLDGQLHTPGHSKSLDLGQPGVLLVAPMKDRKNRSWPRLDRVSLVGYAKLESTGESSDQL
ncbi:T200B protein, partial [Turnix velox]|nr:T200B protein [Turnix velox]